MNAKELIAKLLSKTRNSKVEEQAPPETTLTDGSPVTDNHREINPTTGMQKDYVVLSEEERAKGFVRPVRSSYIHVGPPVPQYPLRELTESEQRRHEAQEYVRYEKYPGEIAGRFWTQAELERVWNPCDSLTTMGQALAETYAREPAFYGGTFCAACGAHFPVGAQGEFIWDDGTGEKVGT